jgi:hypothetical protein
MLWMPTAICFGPSWIQPGFDYKKSLRYRIRPSADDGDEIQACHRFGRYWTAEPHAAAGDSAGSFRGAILGRRMKREVYAAALTISPKLHSLRGQADHTQSPMGAYREKHDGRSGRNTVYLSGDTRVRRSQQILKGAGGGRNGKGHVLGCLDAARTIMTLSGSPANLAGEKKLLSDLSYEGCCMDACRERLACSGD